MTDTAMDKLTEYAISTIWAAPGQDNQVVIKPARLTPLNGSLNNIQVVREPVTLPIKGERFHVYQIGQLQPSILDLIDVTNTWMPISTVMENNNLIIDIYTSNGYQYPRYKCWYMFTKNKDLIVAVMRQRTFEIDFDEHIFLRFYHNHWYSMPDRSSSGNIHVQYSECKTNAEIIAIQQEAIYHNRLVQGSVMCYVNGIAVDVPSILNVSVGDVVEYVYDPSIKKVIEYSINPDMFFKSTLDNCGKYLLYRDEVVNEINYFDDTEVFILKTLPNGFKQGLHYPRNTAKAMRMVTQKDYSLCSDYVDNLATQKPLSVNISDLTIRVVIRESGVSANFSESVFVACRLHELYKLHKSEILQLMVGVNSNVDIWKAASLENSSFTQLMGTPAHSITKELVCNALGYNSITRYLGEPLSVPVDTNGILSVAIPLAYQFGCTVFEYDSESKLLGYHAVNGGQEVYICRDNKTKLIEFTPGLFSLNPDSSLSIDIGDVVNTEQVTIDPLYEYRVYSRSFNGSWKDITNTDKYKLENNTVIWTTGFDTTDVLVRTNKRFLLQKYSLYLTAGYLEIPIQTTTENAVKLKNAAMPVPLGVMDVWINNSPAIEGIDYHVVFPNIYITGREHFISPEDTAQEILIRYTGLCDTGTVEHSSPTNIGYVDHGYLSINNKYDITDDKLVRIVCGKRLYRREDLKIFESGIGLNKLGFANGQPYSICNISVPVKAFTGVTDESLKVKALSVDSEVSTYLTARLEQPVFNTPNVIEHMHQVYSPFIGSLVMGLLHGEFVSSCIYGKYTDNDVRDLCKSREHLLLVEPTKDPVIDTNYVYVRPHPFDYPISFDILQMTFLKNVNRIYLQNKLDFTLFFTTKPFTGVGSE